MHSDKKRCADTLSLSRQAEQNRAEERVSIDTKKGSKYNKSNEKRGGGIQLKKRKWKFRIAGGAVTLLGIYLMAVGYGETITLTIATVVLIFGIAIWSMATPESYNSMTDMIAMISMEKPRKIEEFYEAYKNVDTPFGSAWLAKFYTMRQKALVFETGRQGRISLLLAELKTVMSVIWDIPSSKALSKRNSPHPCIRFMKMLQRTSQTI